MLAEEGAKRSLRTPALVGRDEPWEALEAALSRATRFKAPQFVTVTGPLGIGKTRLLDEWTTANAAAGLRVVSVAAPPDGDGFSVVAELMRRRFGIDERVDPERAL